MSPRAQLVNDSSNGSGSGDVVTKRFGAILSHKLNINGCAAIGDRDSVA